MVGVNVRDPHHSHLSQLFIHRARAEATNHLRQRSFAGVEHDVVDIDAAIAAQLAEGWSLDRLARIELSLLRCGAYELRSMPHIPARAAVSEYAALSDACGCDVGFVNAVLDRMAHNARIVKMGK